MSTADSSHLRSSRLNIDEASTSEQLSLEERFQLCRSVAEECITDDELRKLLDKKPNIVAYDGFEPSGRMHIAQVRSHARPTCHIADHGSRLAWLLQLLPRCVRHMACKALAARRHLA
jgi:hypothetical protein